MLQRIHKYEYVRFSYILAEKLVLLNSTEFFVILFLLLLFIFIPKTRLPHVRLGEIRFDLPQL